MTNYEWLLQMGGEERQAWFDAEHVEGLMDLDSCTHGVRTFASETDSREKLEEDVRRFVYGNGWFDCDKQDDDPELDSRPTILKLFIGWLDRQAAITERELCKQCDWPSLAAQPDLESQERIAELTAQVDELSQQLINARADCEQYRELLSKAITQAAEIVNLQP